MTTLARIRRKPFALWVIAGALSYCGLAFLTLAVPLALAFGLVAAGGFLLIFFLFIALFFIAGAFSLRERRWAYLLAASISIVFVLLFSPELGDSLSNPANSSFWLAISTLPALLLAVTFSILSFRSARTGLDRKRHLATPHSTGGLLTFAVIGFVIGGLVAGAIGAGVILRNIPIGAADIRIVSGALSSATPFDPQTFNVSVGGKVTWLNADTVSHTVTSNDTGLFDSGSLSTGASWSHAFGQAGTYYYHCDPHPQMWGVIIVE